MRRPHHITIFEFYGILPSMKFIVRKFTDHIGKKTQTVAATWRKYQLEYITSSLEHVHTRPSRQQCCARYNMR
jgi:hypothetical protein